MINKHFPRKHFKVDQIAINGLPEIEQVAGVKPWLGLKMGRSHSVFWEGMINAENLVRTKPENTPHLPPTPVHPPTPPPVTPGGCWSLLEGGKAHRPEKTGA